MHPDARVQAYTGSLCMALPRPIQPTPQICLRRDKSLQALDALQRLATGDDITVDSSTLAKEVLSRNSQQVALSEKHKPSLLSPWKKRVSTAYKQKLVKPIPRRVHIEIPSCSNKIFKFHDVTVDSAKQHIGTATAAE